MSQSGTDQNGALPDDAEEFQRQIVSMDDILDDLNFVEAFLNDISGQDEYLEAILQNQRTQLMLALQRAVFSGGIPPGEADPGQLGNLPLPLNSIGIMTRDISEGDDGYAVFFLNGGRFRATIKADEDIQQGQPVVVTGKNNLVEEAAESGSVSGLFAEAEPGRYIYEGEVRAVPSVVTEDDDIKVENQLYDQGEYTTVDGTLDPGESKTIAEINVAPNEFFLGKFTYASAAETVRYNYYIDGSNTPDDDLSGVTPLGTPGSKTQFNYDGFLLIDSSIRLEIEETSGNTSYDNLVGFIEGIKREV